jgi:hypothetical protein
VATTVTEVCLWAFQTFPPEVADKRTTSESVRYNSCMAPCRVSYTDMEGLAHGIDVEADSLYEAVALAVAEFREDAVNKEMPGAMTEFVVSIYRNPTEHRLRFHQVTKWAEHTVKEGPAGIIKRQVRTLLGQRS